MNKYLEGSPAQALEILTRAISVSGGIEDFVTPVAGDHALLKQFYRMRPMSVASEFSKRDLFHIPFEKRHEVSTKRYSLPGFPSLYLGATTHICWVEMGMPDLNTLYVARLEWAGKRPLRLLDLGMSPAWTAKHIGKPGQSRDIVNLAKTWPLTAACSVPVAKELRGCPFIVEYIVPQLLMQWVRHHHKVDGIQYLSVRRPANGDVPYATLNYVFPASETLREDFCMTEPAPWQLLPEAALVMENGFDPLCSAMPVELIKGAYNQYRYTIFGKAERRLGDLKAGPIH